MSDIDPEACKKSDETFWARHPELARRRLTMSRKDKAYRHEWMQLYLQAQADAARPPPPRVIPDALVALPQPKIVSAVTPCGVAAMTHEEKMKAAILRSPVWESLKHEVDIDTLVKTSIIALGAIGLVAATGYGAAAEALAAGLMVVGGALAGYQIGGGLMDLFDFFNDTRCDRARTDADIDAASRKFGSGVSKVGVGAFFLIIGLRGAKGYSWRGAKISPAVEPPVVPKVEAAPKPEMSRYGDLTAEELAKLKSVAAKNGEPIDVVGSTANGTRRGVGTDLPLGKGEGTKSDLDLRMDGEADIRSGGKASDNVYDEFPKGQDVDRILTGEPHAGEPRITVNPEGTVETHNGVPLRDEP